MSGLSPLTVSFTHSEAIIITLLCVKRNREVGHGRKIVKALKFQTETLPSRLAQLRNIWLISMRYAIKC
ncbi:MAG: hypothetical protein ACM3PD_07570, partial [Chloroflexota bacterium]